MWGDAWGDMERCGTRPSHGEIDWGGVGRYMGRYGEMCGDTWGDMGRCGEICGDVGRCAEMWDGEMWDETFFFGGEMVQPLASISSGC